MDPLPTKPPHTVGLANANNYKKEHPFADTSSSNGLARRCIYGPCSRRFTFIMPVEPTSGSLVHIERTIQPHWAYPGSTGAHNRLFSPFLSPPYLEESAGNLHGLFEPHQWMKNTVADNYNEIGDRYLWLADFNGARRLDRSGPKRLRYVGLYANGSCDLVTGRLKNIYDVDEYLNYCLN